MRKSAKVFMASSFVALLMSGTAPAYAGGIFGDVIRGLGDLVGSPDIRRLGDDLDRESRNLKKNVRVYGDLEEAISDGVRHIVTETTVETVGPILAGLIEAGKADARRGELEPLPENVKQAMRSYYDDELIESVRWRVGGGDITLQAGSVKYGTADAITLDNIVVFGSSDLVQNLHLVAHELGHVLQYREWGVMDFAKRYVRNHEGVEAAAERMANEWEASQRPVARAREPFREFHPLRSPNGSTIHVP